MAYAKPPFINNATIASVVGTATGAVLVAPAAGFAYRLIGGQLGVNRAAAGTSDVQLTTDTGRIIARNWGLAGSLGGSNTISLVFPEPGLQLFESEALNIQIISNAAGITGCCVIYWFQDGV